MPMMTNYTGQAGAEATAPAGWGRGRRPCRVPQPAGAAASAPASL